jgi:hypothetical protein
VETSTLTQLVVRATEQLSRASVTTVAMELG